MILLATMGVTYLALSVWLVVRLVNRGECWVKRTSAAVIGVPLLYFVGFGPACWLSDRDLLPEETLVIYLPMGRVCAVGESSLMRDVMLGYGRLLATPQRPAGRWATAEEVYYAGALSGGENAQWDRSFLWRAAVLWALVVSLALAGMLMVRWHILRRVRQAKGSAPTARIPA